MDSVTAGLLPTVSADVELQCTVVSATSLDSAARTCLMALWRGALGVEAVVLNRPDQACLDARMLAGVASAGSRAHDA